MTGTRMTISALVVVAGLLGTQSSTWVNRKLRVIYAEYTLATMDLGHIHGELICYWTSLIRAIEADTRHVFERIAASLPKNRGRIDAAIDPSMKISRSTLSGRGEPFNEVTNLREVRASLYEHVASSQQTINFLAQR